MWRRLIPLLVAMLLTTACGAGTSNEASAPPDGVTTAPSPDAGSVGSDSTGTGQPGGGSPGSTSPQGGTTPGDRDGRTGGGGGSGSIAPQEVGRLAPYLLRPGHGNRIVVEVRAQAGAEPTRATVEHLLRALREASGKTVTVDGVTTIGGTGRAWTSGSLRELADSTSTTAQGGEQVVVRLLFLRGTYDGDGGVLGVAVRGDVAALFSDRIDAAAGLLADPAQIEDAATMHEVGHLLGLVDLFLATGRADPEHPGHSSNTRSVMYWAVESDAITQILGGRVPNEFDADDRADLATIRKG